MRRVLVGDQKVRPKEDVQFARHRPLDALQDDEKVPIEFIQLRRVQERRAAVLQRQWVQLVPLSELIQRVSICRRKVEPAQPRARVVALLPAALGL